MISDKSGGVEVQYENKIQEIMQTKRDQYRVEIRRKNNSELINNKRIKYAMEDEDKDDIGLTDQMINEHMKVMSKDLAMSISTSNISRIEKLVKRLRRFLSRDENPPILQAYQNGFAQQLKTILGEPYNTYDPLVIETTWCLINMSFSTDQELLKMIRDKEMLDLIIKILKGAKDSVIFEHCLWFISNLIADGPSEIRDEFIKNDVLAIIYKALENFNNGKTTVEHLQFLASIIFGVVGQPITFEYIMNKNLVGLLSNFLVMENEEDQNLQFYSIRSLTLIAIRFPTIEMIQEFINCGLVNRLIVFLDTAHPLKKHLVNELWKCFGIIAYGDENQTKELIKANIFGAILEHLSAINTETKRLAAWTLSNILATGENMIAEFYLTKLPERLFEILVAGDKDSVLGEVLYCFSHITKRMTHNQAQRLLDNSLIPIIINLIGRQDTKIIIRVLDILDSFLCFGDEIREEGENNIICDYISREGGISKLENLQYHKEDEVYTMVIKLIERYFYAE